jgi:hypothetical protein
MSAHASGKGFISPNLATHPNETISGQASDRKRFTGQSRLVDADVIAFPPCCSGPSSTGKRIDSCLRASESDTCGSSILGGSVSSHFPNRHDSGEKS